MNGTGKGSVDLRHTDGCRSRQGRPCSCSPRWRARIRVKVNGRPERAARSFETREQAERWLLEVRERISDRGTVADPTLDLPTVEVAIDAWLDRARDGRIVNRSGNPYKPSALRGYRQVLADHIIDPRGVHPLGDVRLDHLNGPRLQAWVDDMVDADRGRVVRNTIAALSAVLRWHVRRQHIAVNPAVGLELPAPPGRRERVADGDEAHRLVDCLGPRDAAFLGVCMFAGLRKGEALGLTWADVNLARGEIDVRRSWCESTRTLGGPKSRRGERVVPISAVLHDRLVAWKAQAPDVARVFPGGKFIDGRLKPTDRPMSAAGFYERVRPVWAAEGLQPIGLHEARHTFVSHAIAAGLNPVQVSTWAGHADVSFTLRQYGHLLPRDLERGRALLDAFHDSHRVPVGPAGVEIARQISG